MQFSSSSKCRCVDIKSVNFLEEKVDFVSVMRHGKNVKNS